MIPIDSVMSYIRDNQVEMVDLKFTDFFGAWHHLTMPSKCFNERIAENGVGFDGGSIPGFKTVESGDMVLIPDLDTMLTDVFWSQKTVSFICDCCDTESLKPFGRDPRHIAKKAQDYLIATGIADKSLWGPEFEFYIFDSITYKNDVNLSFYQIDSLEADWNSGAEKWQNLGHTIPRHSGYHAIPPKDSLYNTRSEMVSQIEAAGIKVVYHHHEVGGPGQSEIEIERGDLLETADKSMLIKYIIKMVARRENKTVTFMPKPLFDEAGSGMHFHQHLFKEEIPLFYDSKGYAGLSQLALYYIGGLLKHSPALLAFTNPSTNSYKRLVPGYEAPVNQFFGLANRSAAIRIPKYTKTPQEKRIEFRPPDGTCNIYLAMVAQLMAGIDGILKKIDPIQEGFGPYDVNLFELPPQERENIKRLPASLKEACEALREDHQFLLQGEVFTEDMIQIWMDSRLHHYNQVRNRPHPYEMTLYYDC